MMTRLAVLFAALLAASTSLAHDEGHGPRLMEEPPKQGGLIASVVDAKDAKLGPEAPLVYKAELIRSDDGTMRLFLYDAKMAPLDGAAFEKKANAIILSGKKKNKKRSFSLSREGGVYSGVAPKAPSRPFNLEVSLKDGKRSLLVAFENLD
ncbi:MAG: hypothetical protein AB1725_06885 [Armatimonadota bacterium]